MLSQIDLDRDAQMRSSWFWTRSTCRIAGTERAALAMATPRRMEAAVELIEEELQPFFEQAGRYHDLGMADAEATCCRGVLLGLDRYGQAVQVGQFREWAVDIPIECAGAMLTDWRERAHDPNSAAAMDEFIRDRCPKWARAPAVRSRHAMLLPGFAAGSPSGGRVYSRCNFLPSWWARSRSSNPERLGREAGTGRAFQRRPASFASRIAA